MDNSNLKETLDTLVDKWNLANHPMFSKLESNGISVEQFAKIMAPFYFAVYFWHDHLNDFYHQLQDLKVDNSYLIKENVMDELGFENGNRHYEKCHTATYINFLHSIGFCSNLECTPGVKKFIDNLIYLMENKSARFNAYVLGSIEYYYIFVSNIISDFCVKKSIQQNHFELHEEIDMKHSMDFFSVAFSCENNQDPELVEILETGFILLWDIFKDLHDESESDLKCISI